VIIVKSRSFFSILGGIVVFSIAIATTSFWWILSNGPLALLGGGVSREPAAAVFVSGRAPLMVSLLVNPGRLESLGQLLVAPVNRRRFHREIRSLEKSLLANTGLDYQREIEPWLGEEITLAVTSLDLDREFANGVRPGYLLVIETKDSERAKEFLRSSYSKQAVSGRFDLVFEPYKGVNLIYQRPLVAEKNERFRAAAVIGDRVLLANQIEVLRDAVNNVQVPDLGLKNSPAYQEALRAIDGPRIGVVYTNLPALSAWIAGRAVPEAPEVVQRLVTALTVKSGGVVAETASIGVSGQEERTPLLSRPVKALSFIDEESLLVAASRDLNRFWQGVREGLEPDSPWRESIVRAVDRARESSGVNLPEEVFGWVTGEYCLALVPGSSATEPDWIFVAERVEGADVDGAIARLDALARADGFTVAELPLLGTPVTAWTKLTASSRDGRTVLEPLVRGVHARVENYEILAGSLGALERALSPARERLLGSEKFKRAIAALPADNDGYFYLDWRRSGPAIEREAPVVQVLELAVKPFFDRLDSLTVGSRGVENGVLRGTVFLDLGPRSR
jgi:hypothetical protein